MHYIVWYAILCYAPLHCDRRPAAGRAGEEAAYDHFRTYDFRIYDSRVAVSGEKLEFVFETCRDHLQLEYTSRLSTDMFRIFSRKAAVVQSG